jgi:hypothetical protein
VTEQRDSAENLIGFKLGERHRGDKPRALREKRKQKNQGDQVVGAHGLGSSRGRHDGLTYFVTLAGWNWDQELWKRGGVL